MATKKRPRAAKAALTRQRAQQRRRSRSKRYIGETAAQSVRAREEQRERVRDMVEAATADEQRAAREAVPLSTTIAALVEDALRLVSTLILAPFRLAAALRRAAATPE